MSLFGLIRRMSGCFMTAKQCMFLSENASPLIYVLLRTEYIFYEDIFLNYLLKYFISGCRVMIFLRSYVPSKMLYCVQAQFLSSKADATMALKSSDWNCANRFYFAFWPVSVVQPSNVVQYCWRITYFLIIPTKVIHSNSILWW